jgi:superfamily II DNA or RNA helicase
MIVEVSNVLTRVTSSSDDELAWIYHFLSFADGRAFFQGRRGGAAKTHLFDMRTQTFPTGLLTLVRRSCAKDSIALTVVDRRARPCEPDVSADTAWLWPHQHEAVAQCLREARGVVHLPTGSGKCEIAIALSRVLPCAHLFLVNSKDLLWQTAERYKLRTGADAGVVGDGVREGSEDRRFVVAMHQTVHRDVRDLSTAWLARFGCLHADEAHGIPSDTQYRVAAAVPNAYFRFAYSATPFARGDRKGTLLVGSFGETICRVTTEELVAAGVIARPIVQMTTFRHESLNADARDWVAAYAALISRNESRDAVVTAVVRDRVEKPCLLFVKELAHGRALVKQLEREKVSCDFVWGAKDVAQRQAAIKRLVRGEIDVLVCNVIFQQGVDIPELRAVVSAAGSRSVIAALQRTGRGSRRRDAQGNVVKDAFVMHDIADHGCGRCRTIRGGRATFEHSGCRWMERHTATRVKAYRAEGYEVVERAADVQAAVDVAQ